MANICNQPQRRVGLSSNLHQFSSHLVLHTQFSFLHLPAGSPSCLGNPPSGKSTMGQTRYLELARARSPPSPWPRGRHAGSPPRWPPNPSFPNLSPPSCYFRWKEGLNIFPPLINCQGLYSAPVQVFHLSALSVVGPCPYDVVLLIHHVVFLVLTDGPSFMLQCPSLVLSSSSTVLSYSSIKLSHWSVMLWSLPLLCFSSWSGGKIH